jgi:hypothetical protein
MLFVTEKMKTMNQNIEIFKFDRNRVGMHYEGGIQKNRAKWLFDFAKQSNFKDFTIKKFKDEHEWSLIIATPKTVHKMIRAFRQLGVEYPEGFEDELYDRCDKVMKSETPDFMTKRELRRKSLTDEEKKMLDKAVEETSEDVEENNFGFTEEELESGTWKEEEE